MGYTPRAHNSFVSSGTLRPEVVFFFSLRVSWIERLQVGTKIQSLRHVSDFMSGLGVYRRANYLAILVLLAFVALAVAAFASLAQ